MTLKDKKLYLAALLVLLLSLLYSTETTKSVVNRSGHREYVVLSCGFPLQFLAVELKAPEGSAGYYTVSLIEAITDYLVWLVVVFILSELYALARRAKGEYENSSS